MSDQKISKVTGSVQLESEQTRLNQLAPQQSCCCPKRGQGNLFSFHEIDDQPIWQRFTERCFYNYLRYLSKERFDEDDDLKHLLQFIVSKGKFPYFREQKGLLEDLVVLCQQYLEG